MNNYVLTVTCPSTRGIVAAISGYLAAEGCNIIDSSQYDDLDTGRFFIRISFISETGTGLDSLRDGFEAVAAPRRACQSARCVLAPDRRARA